MSEFSQAHHFNMNLVGYGSESDASDVEEKPQPSKPAAKPAFQKVVDRASNNKIKVNLSSLKAENGREDVESGPPAKKLRRGPGEGGGGLFSGLSSFLPAPKRANPVEASPGSEENGGSTSKKTLGRGLGSGISLKTGAAPGFTREAMPSRQDKEQDQSMYISGAPGETSTTQPTEEPEVKTFGNATMFRPLSVGKKAGAKKKKTTIPAAAAAATSNTESVNAEAKPQLQPQQATAKPRPQVSLFSMHSADTRSTAGNHSQGYEPLLVGEQSAPAIDDAMVVDDTSAYPSHEPTAYAQATPNAQSEQQSLQSLASDLKLSKAEQRQLFGRNTRGMADMSATNVVNFNTDTEYAANEELRAKGETISHQPVRGIAPGKHSLRQLMNTAVTQKDALEESFAQGAKNRKEAGSKYGW